MSNAVARTINQTCQFSRGYPGPIDLSSVFQTTAERMAYLTNNFRYAGQRVSDLETGLTYMLNAARDAWVSPTTKVANVVDYGADPTFTNDSTEAIQAAINEVFNSGGGVVYFPNGHYKISGPLQTNIEGTNPNSQLYIPLLHTDVLNLPNTFANRTYISFLGETRPNQTNNGILVDYEYSKKGVVLESTLASSSGVAPAIFGGIDVTSVFGKINYNYTSFENLALVSNYNSSTGAIVGGINMANVASTSINNCTVTINRSFIGSVQPTNEVAGIIMNRNATDGANSIRNSNVSGFKYGVVTAEHVVLDQVGATACVNGFVLAKATHSSRYYKVSTSYCAIDFLIPNSTYLGNIMDDGVYIPSSFLVDHFDSEIDTIGNTNWYSHVDVLKDSGNLGRGRMNGYIIERGGAEATAELTKQGGANVYLQWLTASTPSVSGTFTSTFTNTTNITNSSFTLGTCQQIGNIVEASISGQLTPTGAGLTVLTFTLPVAVASITNQDRLCLAVLSINGNTFFIGQGGLASTTTGNFRFVATGTTTAVFVVKLQYKIT